MKGSKARRDEGAGLGQARLRDWARLGMLVAAKGLVGGRRVVSEAWIDEVTSWGPKDQHVRLGAAPEGVPEGWEHMWAGGGLNDLGGVGYKTFFWHLRPDGSLPMFNGAYGQRVVIDMRTGAVGVQVAPPRSPLPRQSLHQHPDPG